MITSNKQTSNHNLMTVKETSELLRIPIPTVYYHIKKGTFPTIRIGGRWRILRDRLNSEFLKIVPDDQVDMKQTNDEQEFINAMVDKFIQALRVKILQRN
jgi:excisionase family DNA binding protein